MEMNLCAHVTLLILFLLYVTGTSIAGARSFRKREESGAAPESRIAKYKGSIRKTLIPAALVLLIVLFSNICFSDIGFRPVRLTYGLWFTMITFILCGALFTVLLVQMIRSWVSEKYRQEIKKTSNKGVGLLLPRNHKERLWWVGCSVNAGICEEIVCRGFLLYLLLAVFPDVSPAVVVAAASAIFGFCHLYQGVSGVLQTAAGGALLFCLYLVTDSLAPAMLLHFFTDVANIFLFSED